MAGNMVPLYTIDFSGEHKLWIVHYWTKISFKNKWKLAEIWNCNMNNLFSWNLEKKNYKKKNNYKKIIGAYFIVHETSECMNKMHVHD